MKMYQQDRKTFNKEVGMAHFDSDSDEDDKLYRAKKTAKNSAKISKNSPKKNKYLSDDDDDEDIIASSSRKTSRRGSKYDFSEQDSKSSKKSILKYDDDEDEDEEELVEKARRRGKEWILLELQNQKVEINLKVKLILCLIR